jgi:hypothetical protein
LDPNPNPNFYFGFGFFIKIRIISDSNPQDCSKGIAPANKTPANQPTNIVAKMVEAKKLADANSIKTSVNSAAGDAANKAVNNRIVMMAGNSHDQAKQTWKCTANPYKKWRSTGDSDISSSSDGEEASER